MHFKPNRLMEDEGFSASVGKRTNSIILEPVLSHATLYPLNPPY